MHCAIRARFKVSTYLNSQVRKYAATAKPPRPLQQAYNDRFTRSHNRQFTNSVRIMHDKFSGSEAPNKVRMMVFETDEPHPETIDEKGTFGDVFDKLFKTAGDNHDPPLGIETAMKFVVEPKGGKVPSVDDLKDVHAILITGSMYDAHGDDEWILKLIKLLQGKQ